jgi:pimeloyl-ACP methyl ester carboxylesterase
VVLVHGATVPMFTWDSIVPGLVAAGYRTVRYDMWGRGHSDRIVRRCCR